MKKILSLILLTSLTVCANNDATSFLELFKRGNGFFYEGKFEQAIETYRHALTFNESCPQIHFNCGVAYERMGDFNHALSCYERAAQQKPDYIKAYLRAGKIHEKNKKYEQAIATYHNALKHTKDTGDIHHQLGKTYRSLERYIDAIEHLNQALHHKPNDIPLLFDIGYTHLMFGRIDKTVKSYERILSLSPDSITVLYNMAYALKMGDRLDEAVDWYHKVISLQSDHENAHFGLARAYLTKGDFERGWQTYEWYLKKIGRNAEPLRYLLKTTGLVDKTIFLRPEGSFGDTIQFIRFAQTFKTMGAKVVVAVQKQLVPLLARCTFIDKLITIHDPFPPCDAECTIMNAPAVLCSSEMSLAEHVPYIVPDPELIDYWRKKLSSESHLKIGICWQADLHNDTSRAPVARRGIPLEKLQSLFAVPGTRFYSLQKVDGLEQLEHLDDPTVLHQFPSDFDETHGSFMDTAAVMKNLDLVITVDTAIAHLAGALDVPVWVMLPYSTDWRWITGRVDSPWYPSMRLFKQPAPFDWESVVSEVVGKIREKI